MAQDPKDVNQGSKLQPTINLRDKLQSSEAAKDANRDQNFDGTNQAGKDTLGTPKAQVPADSGAESSQLSVNAMNAKGSAVTVGAKPVIEPGSVTVAEDAKGATTLAYFRSSVPGFNFNYGTGPGERARFANYWLITNVAKVADYVRDQLVGAPGMVRVSEEDESVYNDDRRLKNIVQPTFEPLPNQENLDAAAVRAIALSAKAPRTDANPDLLEPETGNAQQDHFTEFARVQTDDLDNPIVDDRTPAGIQARRNAEERAAAGGAKPAADSRANPPVGGLVGGTNSVNMGAVAHPNAGSKT